MRLLLPGFVAFLIWSTATMALYQHWFMPGALRPESNAAGAKAEQLLQAELQPFDRTEPLDNPTDLPMNPGLALPEESIVPSAQPSPERLNLVRGSATAPWLPDQTAAEALETWAKRLADQPGSGIVIFCNYLAVEGPLNPTTGASQHPATARGNAIRKELFRHGIQPARCTLVYRQLSEDDLKHQGYAQLIFTADDPVPWSPSMPGTLSAFARINPEKELPSAMSGEWGLLLTRHLRFAYGSSSLPDDPETEAFFSNFSEYLNRHPEKSVCITGHTCDISSAGFNQRLGAARAASVRERLLELGVAPDRLQTGSAGEEQPIGENGSNQGQKANRRVELLIR